MPLLSGLLDFVLSLVCLAIARASMRVRNDFFFSGMLWIAAAAFMGAFNLAGFTQVAHAHAWLSDVSRGPGMFALALGVLAALYGPWNWSRWGAMALAIAGAASIQLLADSPVLDTFTTLLGVTLLLALLLLAAHAFREHRLRAAVTALLAVLLFLFVGFGMSVLPLAKDGLIRSVDVLHVLLAACYTLVWLSMRGMARADVMAN
jgi:putative effector of murein hydrolase LrgA (UPF0299 family)